MELTIALVQMRCEKGDLSGNLLEMERFVAEAARHSAGFLVFPEMCITGYIDPAQHPEAVLGREHEAVDRVVAMSRKHGLTIVSGFVEQNPGGKPFITHFVASRGERLGFYRKVTVVDEEADWFSAGSGVPVFHQHGLDFAVSICADIDNPAVFQEAAAHGASIVFECAAPGLYGEQAARNWASGFNWWRGECHEKLARYARENRLFIGVSTQAGRTVDEDFPGGGYLFAPSGECIAETPDWSEGVLFCAVEL